MIAVTNYHNPSGLKQGEFTHLQFWGLQVCSQGVWWFLREVFSFPGFWWLPAILGTPWFVPASLQSLLPLSPASFLLLSLIKTPVISWKQHKSISRGMDKEDVVHIYNGVLFSQKKTEIMPFAATVDEPRAYHSKSSQSDREREVLYESKEMMQTNLFTK